MYKEIKGTITSDLGTTEFTINKPFGWVQNGEDLLALEDHMYLCQDLQDLFDETNEMLKIEENGELQIKDLTENFSLRTYWVCPSCGTPLPPNTIERTDNVMTCPECEYKGNYEIPTEMLI